MTEKDLSNLEKLACVLGGPFVGWLPPRLQMKVASGDERAACLLSSSSRVVNGVLSSAVGISLVARLWGVDVDPSPGEAFSWVGGGLLFDTLVREVGFGMRYMLNGGSVYDSYNAVGGEPLVSLLDAYLCSNPYEEKIT